MAQCDNACCHKHCNCYLWQPNDKKISQLHCPVILPADNMMQQAECAEEEEGVVENNDRVRRFAFLALVIALHQKKRQSRFINRLSHEGHSRRRRSLLRESPPLLIKPHGSECIKARRMEQ